MRPPTTDELATELESSAHRVRQLVRWSQTALSFETPINGNTDSTLGDILADQDVPELDDTMTYLELREKLQETMNTCLQPKERTYLTVRFGLDGSPGQTLNQAARQLGLTRTRACTVEKRALKQLRSARELRDLRQ